MDKREAIKRFIRENKILLAPEATRKDVMLLIRTFSQRNNLRAGTRFTAKDVALEVAETICRANAGNEKQARDKLEASKFLSGALAASETRVLLQKYASGSTDMLVAPRDLSKLDQEEYVEGVLEGLKETAREEVEHEISDERAHIDEMRLRLEAKEAELEAFSSALDEPSLSMDFADDAKLDESPDGDPEWWRRLGLTADPFPSNIGLDGFDPDAYEEIVVPTDVLRQITSVTSQPKTKLYGKASLLIGEFGSGKTTIIEYTGHHAGKTTVVPIQISLEPRPSSGDMLHRFESRFYSHCRRLYQRVLGRLPDPDQPNGDYLWNAGDILFELQEERKDSIDGYVLTIDGLHKGDEYIEQVFAFLQQIQTVSEQLRSKKVKAGIVLAGSSLWNREIRNRRSLSGSFQSVIEIPNLSETDAVEAVMRRFKACGIDQTASRIDRPGLRTAYSTLIARTKGIITFREYLDHVRARFEGYGDGDRDQILVQVHAESVDTVSAAIENSPVHVLWDHLKPSLQSEPGRTQIRVVLRHLATNPGVREDHEFFKRHRAAFQELRRSGLIVQRRTGRWWHWVLDNTFMAFLLDCYTKYRIGPAEAVSALATPRPEAIRRESRTIYSGILGRVQALVSRTRDSWQELSAALRELELALEKVVDTAQEKRPDPSAVRSATEALQRCLFMAVVDRPIAGDRFWDYRGELWIRPEGLTGLRSFCAPDLTLPTRPNELWAELQGHVMAASAVMDLVEECVVGEPQIPLCRANMSRYDKQALHEVRVHLHYGRMKDALDDAAELVEERIRSLAYLGFRALAGHSFAKLFPDDVRKALETLKPRGRADFRRELDANPFRELSRSQYEKVLFGTRLKNCFLAPGREKRTIQDLHTALADLFSLDDREKHNDRPAYFRENASAIMRVAAQVPAILTLLDQIPLYLLSQDAVDVRLPDGSHQLKYALPNGEHLEVTAPPREESESLAKDLLAHLRGGPLSIQEEHWYTFSPAHSAEEHLAVAKILILHGQVALNHDRLEMGLADPISTA